MATVRLSPADLTLSTLQRTTLMRVEAGDMVTSDPLWPSQPGTARLLAEMAERGLVVDSFGAYRLRAAGRAALEHARKQPPPPPPPPPVEPAVQKAAGLQVANAVKARRKALRAELKAAGLAAGYVRVAGLLRAYADGEDDTAWLRTFAVLKLLGSIRFVGPLTMTSSLRGVGVPRLWTHHELQVGELSGWEAHAIADELDRLAARPR